MNESDNLLTGGKLIGQGTYGCVYYPGISCSGKKSKDKEYVTKIMAYNSNLKKEIYISQLIRKIKNYKQYFVPISKSCPIKLERIDEKNISFEKCDVIQNKYDSDFILTYLRYVNGKDLHDLVNDVSQYSDNMDKKIFDSIVKKFLYYYSYLLNSINVLVLNDIIHMDLKKDNIMTTISSRKASIPLIIDFGLSINMKKIKNILDNDDGTKYYNYLMEDFFIYAPDVDYWCLEIHFINFILHNNYDGREYFLNEININGVIEKIVNENKGYNLFGEKYIKNFKLEGINFMREFIGKTNKETIYGLLSFYTTWDNFSLSIMFLRIFKIFSDKASVINQKFEKFESIREILLINISPDPRKRLTIKDTQKSYSKIK